MFLLCSSLFFMLSSFLYCGSSWIGLSFDNGNIGFQLLIILLFPLILWISNILAGNSIFGLSLFLLYNIYPKNFLFFDSLFLDYLFFNLLYQIIYLYLSVQMMTAWIIILPIVFSFPLFQLLLIQNYLLVLSFNHFKSSYFLEYW